MRRFAARLSGGLTCLIFFAVVALWVRSYWLCDVFSISHQRQWIFSANRGALLFSVLTRRPIQGSLGKWVVTGPPCAVSSTLRFEHFTVSAFQKYRSTWLTLDTETWEVTGGFFGSMPPTTGFQTRGPYLLIPAWAIPAACGASATVWSVLVHLPRLRRRRRRAQFACVFCGYDVRATPDRCPECGKVVEPVGYPASPPTMSL
jgi:hypothetical protein